MRAPPMPSAQALLMHRVPDWSSMQACFSLCRYDRLIQRVTLSGPTSFAPAIYHAIRLVREAGGQYHILIIVADGQVCSLPPAFSASVDMRLAADMFLFDACGSMHGQQRLMHMRCPNLSRMCCPAGHTRRLPGSNYSSYLRSESVPAEYSHGWGWRWALGQVRHNTSSCRIL